LDSSHFCSRQPVKAFSCVALCSVSDTMPVSASDLAAAGTTLTGAIIETYSGNAHFDMLGKQYLDELLARDEEDGDKLQKGIQLAIDKGVLPAKVDVEKTTIVFADEKTPEEVTEEVIKALGDAPSKGCVMTLQGLSGTGKGTTVDMLKQKLPKAQTWSNGNIFRSLTLLAKTYAEQNKCTIEDALTPELLKEFMGYLTFDKFGDSFDTKIEGLGLKHMVSEVQNTVLKTVSKDIPTVAEKTQGEVVTFIQDALQKMTAAGVNVLLEGRAQTLNYIRTPHRFELKLKDMSVVGLRQAALIIGLEVKKTIGSVTDAAAIKAALDKEVIERLVVDMKVTVKKSTSFYIRAAASFLKGMEAKPAVDDKPALEAKSPVNKMKISGLGEAINTAVAVALRVEADGLGVIKSIQTKNLDMGKGSCAQIVIAIDRK